MPLPAIRGGYDRAYALLNSDTVSGRRALAELKEHGFTIVRSIFGKQDCDLAVDKIWEFARGRCPSLKAYDEATWTADNWWCVAKAKNLCQLYGAGWVLCEERLQFRRRLIELGVYAEQPHHVSWDGFTFGRATKRLGQFKQWDHMDQRLRDGKSTGCTWLQGSVALTQVDPINGACFECWPGSHKDDVFIALQNSKELTSPRSSEDYVPISDKGRKWLQEHGFQKQRVAVGLGDALLWDSRLVHQGGYPLTPEGSQCVNPVGTAASRPGRIVAYICLGLREHTPAETLTKRKTAYEEHGEALTLTHAPDVFRPFKRGRFHKESPPLHYPENLPLDIKELHGIT